MSFVRFYCMLFVFAISMKSTNASCRHHPRWPHKFKMEDVFGMWFAVEMAQHAPDLTNKPDQLGCLMLHIVDVADEIDVWHESSSLIQEDTVQNSKYNKPFDWRRKRNTRPKRADEVFKNTRLRLLWDEKGQTLEQVYLYSDEEPALWVAQQAKDDPWHPYAETKREEIIYVLKATPSFMVLHHCMDNGRPMTLVFRRLPIPLKRWERAQFRNVLKSQKLLDIYRESAVCLTCRCSSSPLLVLFGCLQLFLRYFY